MCLALPPVIFRTHLAGSGCPVQTFEGATETAGVHSPLGRPVSRVRGTQAAIVGTNRTREGDTQSKSRNSTDQRCISNPHRIKAPPSPTPWVL